jgi:periplasmic protein TonB
MNSVNLHTPRIAGETSPQRELAAAPRQTHSPLTEFVPTTSATGPSSKRRLLVGALVGGVQFIFVMGLALGLTHKEKPIAAAPMVVDILPTEEKFIPPPPPPMKPHLATPQIVMNIPVAPQIYEPPPPIAAPPSERALTTSPTPVTSDPDAAIQTFQVRLLRHLNRHKRYPPGARARRQQGVVYVRFVMDRRGNVLSALLEKACGFDTLNAEGLALLKRAQPLPIPPPEMEGNSIEMIVPVDFSLR